MGRKGRIDRSTPASLVQIGGEPIGRVEKEGRRWKAIVHRSISGNLVMHGFPTRREAVAEVRIMRGHYEP